MPPAPLKRPRRSLRKLREGSGLTQRELAVIAGCGTMTVFRAEKSKKWPKDPKICLFLLAACGALPKKSTAKPRASRRSRPSRR